MSTYSLTLRTDKGSKLTSQELDNNFLYVLENSSGSVDIDHTQVAFGSTSSGLTSSEHFTFEKNQINLIIGLSHSVVGTVSNSVILGGYLNSFILISSTGSATFSDANSIFNSSIIGGCYNTIQYSSHSSIVGGACNSIIGISDSVYDCSPNYNTILGGCCNTICKSDYSSIIGGGSNAIIGYDGDYSAILAGRYNIISDDAEDSVILGGCYNSICYDTQSSGIIGGACNKIENSSCGSVILGGCCNTLSNNSKYSSIIGGCCNTLSDASKYSSIIGGRCNTLTGTSSFSSILGGFCNTIGTQSCNSAILGGNNLQLNNQCDTVLVPSLLVAGSFSSNCGVNFGLSGNFTGITSICVINGMIVSIV